MTSYSVALHMASQGVGVALGWRRLVAPMIEAGTLSIIRPHTVPAPHQFYIAGLPDDALSGEARALKTWLLNSVQG